MTLEQVRASFCADKFATNAGCKIVSFSKGHAVCEMELDRELHYNCMGAVMGGAIFTLADFAFAAASNSRHRPTVGQQISINFLSATRGKRLIARAACKKDGRTSCVYNIDVTDDLGRDIAQFVGTGYKQ